MVPKPKTKYADTRSEKNGKLKKRSSHAKAPALSKDSISINATKSKIRDVRRLLEHAHDLPPGVRIEKERALAGYVQDLEKATLEKNRSQMISKYHMVRFFERRKAERSIRNLNAKLKALEGEGAEDEEKELMAGIKEKEVDLAYANYYPLTEKYISLYPRGGNQEEVAMGMAKPPMWEFVEKCMREGTLDLLREGGYNVKPDGKFKTRDEIAPALPSKSDGRKEMDVVSRGGMQGEEENWEDSDGGFFEE